MPRFDHPECVAFEAMRQDRIALLLAEGRARLYADGVVAHGDEIPASMLDDLEKSVERVVGPSPIVTTFVAITGEGWELLDASVRVRVICGHCGTEVRDGGHPARGAYRMVFPGLGEIDPAENPDLMTWVGICTCGLTSIAQCGPCGHRLVRCGEAWRDALELRSTDLQTRRRRAMRPDLN